jgi:hypothetical protein
MQRIKKVAVQTLVHMLRKEMYSFQPNHGTGLPDGTS